MVECEICPLPELIDRRSAPRSGAANSCARNRAMAFAINRQIETFEDQFREALKTVRSRLITYDEDGELIAT